MKAVILISIFHLFAFIFYVVMTEITISVVLAIILSYLFCALPMLFSTNAIEVNISQQDKINENGTNLFTFAFFLALPIVILIYERVLYGFEITLNPVMMRDQMILRHREGGGGGIFAVLGNLSHIPAMYFFFKYLLLEKAKASKSIVSTLYITATIWMAGSRAFMMIILMMLWAKNNLKLPRFTVLLSLIILFILITYVFVLRADRSNVDVSLYVFRIFDHLRVNYDDLGEQIINSALGPIALSVAYILHSVQSLGDILSSGSNDGLSLAPLVHFLSIFTDLDNSSYGYQGLFLTSFGLFYHDLGILGVICILIVKCLIMFHASRARNSFFAMSIVLILTADSVMGIWTSIINIVFMVYIILALVCIAVTNRINVKLRR